MAKAVQSVERAAAILRLVASETEPFHLGAVNVDVNELRSRELN